MLSGIMISDSPMRYRKNIYNFSPRSLTSYKLISDVVDMMHTRVRKEKERYVDTRKTGAHKRE